MKKIFIFILFFIVSVYTVGGVARDSENYVKSDKNAYKTGLIFKDPRTNPRAKRVLKVYPEKGAIDYAKVKATSCDNSAYLPPVENQGQQGSCTAWAVGYYFKTYQENFEAGRTDAAQRADSNNICSPAFIYNLIHAEGDNGSYFSDAFNVLNTLGCCSLAQMPYDDSDYTTWPSKNAFIDAMKRKTITPNNGYDFYYISLDGDADIDSVKQLLLNGNVVIFGIEIYDNYINISDYNNIYALADKTGTDQGGHAQCIVGFDDNFNTPDGLGAFKVVNSWGTNWGDSGFYWISYEAIKKASDYSQGYAFWVDDRIDYNPEYYVLMNLTHPYSRETEPYLVTSTGNRLDFFDFYVNQDNYEYNPYPSTDIAIDVTDLDPSAADYITLYVEDIADVTNGQGGSINEFSYVVVASGDESFSSDTPVDFPDNGTGSARVYFSGNDYTITATAYDGGTIEPSGDVVVHEGTSKTFTITPLTDFHIFNVKVDGNSVGAVDSYTFSNVTSNHTIEAYFERDQDKYVIKATATEGGSIDPSGEIEVLTGNSITFTITPEEGYFINDVLVDSASVGRISEYTFDSVRASHTIHAVFSTSLLPEITEASGKSVSGTSPLKVDFSCNAYDPDGGNIVKYIWKIKGNVEDTLITYTNTCSYTFIAEGEYKVEVTVVDDEGESATAEIKDSSGNTVTLDIYKPADLKIPVFAYAYQAKSDLEKSTTVFVNPSLEDVTLKVNFYDDKFNLLSTEIKVLPAMAKFVFSPEDYGVEGYSEVLISADNYLLVFNVATLQNGLATAYSLPVYTGKLYIPHIAEEVDYWDSTLNLCDISPVTSSSDSNLKVSIDDKATEFTVSHYVSTLNLEQCLPDSLNASKTWGTVETVSHNPFEGSPSSLSGFELFVHNGTDGAATELVQDGAKTLFIPHIPEETGIFWTGFTLVNIEDSEASVSFEFYSDTGEMLKKETLSINGKEKLKGTMSQLFPDMYGKAQWGIIKSDRKLIGIEIYGTNDAAICGYNLPDKADSYGILPYLITGEGNWNGVVFTNPSDETVSVVVTLVSKDGVIKEEKSFEIEAVHRYKAVVKDMFESSIEEGDYLKYQTSGPVIAVGVCGDLNRTFMASLVGMK